MNKSVFSVADVRNVAQHIKLTDILDTYHQFLNEHPGIVESLKLPPDTFKRLNQFFVDEQHDREMQGIKSMPSKDVWLTDFYGMRVIVDPEMKPGTWKFIGSGAKV